MPEYKKLRTTQEGLLKELGDPTRREQSGPGNVYYLNEIGDAIAKVYLKFLYQLVSLICIPL